MIEAATENRDLKGKIFGQVDGLVSESAILCSNSSHLEPEVIFAGLSRKGRTAVVHYFFPRARSFFAMRNACQPGIPFTPPPACVALEPWYRPPRSL